VLVLAISLAAAPACSSSSSSPSAREHQGGGAPPRSEVVRSRTAGGSRSRPVQAPPPKTDPLVQAFAEDARRQIAGKLGWDFPGSLETTIGRAATKNAKGKEEENYAFAGGVWTGAGYVGCQIEFNNRLNATSQEFANTIFHEMVHCFQTSLYPTEAAYDAAHNKATWSREGAAEWVGATLTVPDQSTAGRWKDYLTTPEKSLFDRDPYTAIGFFAHLEESGTSPWSVFRAMWLAWPAGNKAVFAASGAGDAFLDTWASGYFRGRVKGAAWDTTGPGISKDQAKPEPFAIGPEVVDQTRKTPRFTNSIYQLKITADIVEIEAGEGSHVRLSDGRTDAVVRGTQEFCVRPNGCVCPRDQDQQAPTALLPDAALAVTGGIAGSKVTVTGSSLKNLEDLCCGPKGRSSTAQDVTIKPVVNCSVIGLRMGRGGGLRFDIGYQLLVDRPRLRPYFTASKGKNAKKRLAGVDLEGIKGIQLDFAAGAVNGSADNQKLEFDVPTDLELPVRPRAPGLPRTMKVHWKVAIKTGITGNNSSFHAQGRFGFGGPFGIHGGSALKPAVTTETNPVNNLTGITLGPSAIIIAVSTQFTAGAGTPRAARGTFGALTAGFTATQGSVLGSPLLVCRQVSLAVFFTGGGGSLGRVKKKVFDGKSSVPDFNICGGN